MYEAMGDLDPAAECAEGYALDSRAEQDNQVRMRNARLVFRDPDAFFGRDFLKDLLMEQQEQM